MKKEILKRLISSISATTLAATSLGLNTVLAADAENTTPVAHVHEAEELTEELFHDHECEDHDHECEEHDHDDCIEHNQGGKGVTIALLDAGVTNFETAGKTSFIDDDTIDSDHGNDMMSIISDVAPEADVLDVRVLDDEGKGTYSTVEKGIRWSVDNNADIIVMSFVGENRSSLLENALAYAEEHEVLVVASAGNYSNSQALYPAAYPTVISVGALDTDGNIQDYSNFGDYVDTYVEWCDGTSGAAQYIAATAAVTMEHDPDITVSDLRASYNADKPNDITAAAEENADTVVYSAATCKSHSYRWVTIRYATCTSSGLRQYKCSKCGRVANSSYTAALGHNYTAWSYTKQPTCTSKGTQSHRCTRCGRTETRSYGGPYGHSFNGSYTITKQPTCTATGTKVGKCTRCGVIVSTVTIPAKGHSFTDWSYSKQPTCTAMGTQTRKCRTCGRVETRQYGGPYGHNFNGSYTITKQPTCTATGTKVGKCTRCGAVVSTVTIPAKGHSFTDWSYSKRPTCTEKGTQTRKCKTCGKVETRQYGEPYGHSFNGSYNITKQPTCTATGTKVGKCTRCGAVVSTVTIPALNHNYKWEVVKDSTCLATGTRQYKCTRCKNVSKTETIAKKDHTFNGSYTTTKQPTCTTAGTKVGKCTKCNTVVSTVTIPALNHNYKWEVVKDSTCLATGTRQYKCTRCKNVSKTETIAKKDHTFNGSYTTTKKATCTTDGEKVGKCTKCNTVVSKVTIPKIGGSHNYGSWEHNSDPDKCTRTCSKCGEKETAAHSFNGSFTTIIDSTYTTEGKRVGKCTRCGKTLTTIIIPKKTPQLMGTAGKNNTEVYIVKWESDSVLAAIQKEHPGAIIVADDTAASNPNYHVYNSALIKDKQTIADVCDLVADYNTCDEWTRSAESFAGEWKEHNFLYSTLGKFSDDVAESAQHVDADANQEGYPWYMKVLFH